MADINRTTYFYRLKFSYKENQFNKPAQLPMYFAPMIGDKKEVKIAELGAGPINTIGNTWPDTKVEIHASDLYADEYNKFWKHHRKVPLVPVTYQNMENLICDDEMFDIVHCVNAVDHTPNPMKAIEEMKRVCKRGGWIYLRHAKGQKDRYRGIHYWNYEELKLPEFIRTLEGDLIVDIYRKGYVKKPMYKIDEIKIKDYD